VLCLVAVPPAGAAPCAGFTDVEDTSGFCTSVAWMKNRGITQGCTSTAYCPNDFVRRDQMAAFMYRLGFQNAFLAGGNSFGATAVLGTTDSHALDVVVSGVRRMRYDTAANVIGSSPLNSATGSRGVVAGGGGPGTCFAPDRPQRPCVNMVSDEASSVGGGVSNIASGGSSTISGGLGNTASGASSTVAGGAGNLAGGIDSTVAGGVANNASGRRSFAAGGWANAAHDGCFVWADTTGSSATSCFGVNEFVARSTGGFYFWTAGSNDSNYSGARLAPGTGAWAAYSDVQGKEALEPVDADDILERLVAMPVARWQWKAEPGSVKHIGPTAQDFHAAFGLGDSDKQIVTVDADGVALAAIQGLNAKLESAVSTKDAEIHSLKRELDALRAAHQTQIADLRLAVEGLIARTADGRVAQTE
jgi:hypothetical protein